MGKIGVRSKLSENERINWIEFQNHAIFQCRMWISCRSRWLVAFNGLEPNESSKRCPFCLSMGDRIK